MRQEGYTKTGYLRPAVSRYDSAFDGGGLEVLLQEGLKLMGATAEYLGMERDLENKLCCVKS